MRDFTTVKTPLKVTAQVLCGGKYSAHNECVPNYIVPGQTFAGEVVRTHSVLSQRKCGNSTSRYVQGTVPFSFLIQLVLDRRNGSVATLSYTEQQRLKQISAYHGESVANTIIIE